MASSILNRKAIMQKRRSLQLHLHPLFQPRGETVLHDDAGAGVPAEECVVVAVRTDDLGLLVVGHGFAQVLVRFKAGAGAAATELGLSSALVKDALVVRALVRVAQAANHFARLG